MKFDGFEEGVIRVDVITQISLILIQLSLYVLLLLIVCFDLFLLRSVDPH